MMGGDEQVEFMGTMEPTGHWALAIVTLFCLSLASAHGETRQSPEEALNSALGSISSLNRADTHYVNELRSTAAYGAKEVALPALIQLWFRGEASPVELAWWKSAKGNFRTVIVALFLCDRTDDIEWIPDFKSESNRFGAEERKERLDEIDYVMSHRKELALLLYTFLKDRSKTEKLTESQQTLLNNYQASAQ